MKMSKILALILALLMVVSMFAACSNNTTDETKGNDETTDKTDDNKGTEKPAGTTNELAGTYDITMWVSEKEGVADQFKAQIADFMKDNPGIVINASIEGVAEGDAGSKVVADVATAPDIYCFAQDQLARLVQASALAKPGKKATENIKANNDAGSVAAATVAGELYAYPMTSDNGYYMYYDKSVITNPESLEQIIADCEAGGKKIRYALENGWYTASFFFGTGCTSTWAMNENGEFIGVDDTFNSAEGIVAMKGMQMLAQSKAYDSNADIFTDAAVVVTGIWNAEAATAHFGENLAATDLPSFTVDGKEYHIGSFSGNKLMGVKPQTDAKRGAVLSQLAQYLTGEKCQNDRFASFQWGPSNIKVQASDAVQANISLAALAKQNAYATPQGQISGAWWDIAKVLGADAKAATSAEDLQKALDNYDAAIAASLSLDEATKNAWTVIGSVGGTNWDTDFTMTEEPAGTWTSVEIDMTAGEEFKVRQGLSWDVDYGQDGVKGGANIVVETTGKYKVQLVFAGETVTITLIPA